MIFPRMSAKIFKPFESSGFLKRPPKFEKISRLLLSKHQNIVAFSQYINFKAEN